MQAQESFGSQAASEERKRKEKRERGNRRRGKNGLQVGLMPGNRVEHWLAGALLAARRPPHTGPEIITIIGGLVLVVACPPGAHKHVRQPPARQQEDEPLQGRPSASGRPTRTGSARAPSGPPWRGRPAGNGLAASRLTHIPRGQTQCGGLCAGDCVPHSVCRTLWRARSALRRPLHCCAASFGPPPASLSARGSPSAWLSACACARLAAPRRTTQFAAQQTRLRLPAAH